MSSYICENNKKEGLKIFPLKTCRRGMIGGMTILLLQL